MTSHDHRHATRTHESAHVVGMLITVGRLPELVRADFPTERSYGYTRFPWPEDRSTQDLIPEFVIAVMLGYIANGRKDWPPAWPPDREAEGDERQLAAAVSLGNLDQEDYERLAEMAEDVAQWPDFKRMVSLVARALEQADGILDRDDLARVLGPERLKRYATPKHLRQEQT